MHGQRRMWFLTGSGGGNNSIVGLRNGMGSEIEHKQLKLLKFNRIHSEFNLIIFANKYSVGW